MRDRRLIYATALLRSLGTGLVGILLGIYLAKLGLDAAQVGAVIGLGLAGAAVAAMLVTFLGDRIGRRTALLVLACTGALGTSLAVASPHPAVIAVAAFFGMLNGMGRDRGASLVLEQAILPATASAQNRTLAFAWYNVLQDAGHAGGALLAATPVLLRIGFGVHELTAIRIVLGASAALLLICAALYLQLSPATEVPGGRRSVPVSVETRRALWKLSSLFGLDSIAGGFLTTSLLSYFFFERFGAGESAVGILFFAARIANAASHFGAAWLARRIGLINTMVFTHVPSSLFLVAVPFAPSFAVAAVLFLLRELLVEMDVPTRQSYVMSVVQPEERTLASGITSVVRVGGWAVAPGFAGALMQGAALGAPLFVGAGMKIVYDLLLFAAFRKQRAPEES